jgi:hypothetical protein
MHFLGLDYIISSLIWLTIIFSLVFTFRKHIAKLFYPQTSLDLFISKLKHYLQETYPKIKFDLEIIETSKTEQNPDLRKYIIVGNILDQYKNLTLDKSKFPKSTPTSLRWDSYIFNCEPNKDKLPPDWAKRKNALIIRDHKRCIRCSKIVTLSTIEIHLIRPISDGGKYYLENLISVCKDCEKVLINDPKKMATLHIKDDLEHIVSQS